MSISQKFKEFIAPMDEDDVLEVEQEEDTPSISEYERPKSKVNHLPTDTKMVRLSLVPLMSPKKSQNA